MGVEVGIERADVAPVAPLMVTVARHDVGRVVIHVSPTLSDQVRDQVAAQVVLGILDRGVGTEGIDQDLHVEHVVAHGDVGLVGSVGETRGIGGLFQERLDLRTAGGIDHAELVGFVPVGPQGGNGDPGARSDVSIEHLTGVHPIDVVRPEHEQVPGLFVVDDVQVLEQRIGRTGEPLRTPTHLGRHRRHVVAKHARQSPGAGQVDVEGVTLVLGQHHDLAVSAVHQIRQREVDQPVRAAEGHARFGPVRRQRHEAFALASGQDDGQDAGAGSGFEHETESATSA